MQSRVSQPQHVRYSVSSSLCQSRPVQSLAECQVGNGVLDQAMKHSSNYEDMINRANESGADPADVQDVLQGAMDRNKGD